MSLTMSGCSPKTIIPIEQKLRYHNTERGTQNTERGTFQTLQTLQTLF